MKEKPPWCLFEIYHMYGVVAWPVSDVQIIKL